MQLQKLMQMNSLKYLHNYYSIIIFNNLKQNSIKLNQTILAAFVSNSKMITTSKSLVKPTTMCCFTLGIKFVVVPKTFLPMTSDSFATKKRFETLLAATEIQFLWQTTTDVQLQISRLVRRTLT